MEVAQGQGVLPDGADRHQARNDSLAEMFFAVLAGVVGLILVVALARGPRVALAVGWGAILVLPFWMGRDVPGLFLSFRTAVGALLLVGCLCLRSGRPLRIRFVALDAFVLAYTAALFASITAYEDFRFFNLISLPCRWLLPYALGRLAYETIDDQRRLLTATVAAIIVLSLWGMFEAVTLVDPVRHLAGRGAAPTVRLGLGRARGPMSHPIFFGLLMVMLLPWALEAARRSKAGGGPSWWAAVPWINFAGILTSMSRGPLIAGVLTLAGTAFLYRTRWRVPILAGGMLAFSTVWFAESLLIDSLHALSGENEQPDQYVMINGEPVPYSGTRHRLLLFVVYEDAIAEAGLLGYGRWRSQDLLTNSGAGLSAFGSVDNHYIFTLLRAGYAGFGAFLMMGVTAVSYVGARGIRCSRGVLRGAICAAMGAVLLLLLTVWFQPAFGFVWMFSAGLVATWRSAPAAVEEAAAVGPVAPRPRLRRLVPGHFVESPQGENGQGGPAARQEGPLLDWRAVGDSRRTLNGDSSADVSTSMLTPRFRRP